MKQFTNVLLLSVIPGLLFQEIGYKLMSIQSAQVNKVTLHRVEHGTPAANPALSSTATRTAMSRRIWQRRLSLTAWPLKKRKPAVGSRPGGPERAPPRINYRQAAGGKFVAGFPVCVHAPAVLVKASLDGLVSVGWQVRATLIRKADQSIILVKTSTHCCGVAKAAFFGARYSIAWVQNRPYIRERESLDNALLDGYWCQQLKRPTRNRDAQRRPAF